MIIGPNSNTTSWRIVYAADYRPVRIIDLRYINYRPPQNTNCACSILYFGAWAELTWLDLMWSRCTILPVTYTINMIIALIACRDQEAKIWRPKSMVYFSHAQQPGASQLHKNFNITSQANASSDERTQWDRQYKYTVLALIIWKAKNNLIVQP